MEYYIRASEQPAKRIINLELDEVAAGILREVCNHIGGDPQGAASHFRL